MLFNLFISVDSTASTYERRVETLTKACSTTGGLFGIISVIAQVIIGLVNKALLNTHLASSTSLVTEASTNDSQDDNSKND